LIFLCGARLCAAALSGGLARVDPAGHLLLGTHAHYTEWHSAGLTTPWIWSAQSPHDLRRGNLRLAGIHRRDSCQHDARSPRSCQRVTPIHDQHVLAGRLSGQPAAERPQRCPDRRGHPGRGSWSRGTAPNWLISAWRLPRVQPRKDAPSRQGGCGCVLPALLPRVWHGAGVGSVAWVRPDLLIG
jgi:hypothetical protein